MVASSALMLGATIASTAASTGTAGMRFRAKKRANRQKRAALGRQIDEEVKLHMFRETERSQQLAKEVATQMASLVGVGILSGSTADLLRTSTELSASVDRARDAGSTAATINQLVTGIEQSRLSDQASLASLPFTLADEVGSFGQTIGQQGTDVRGARQVDVKTAGSGRAT